EGLLAKYGIAHNHKSTERDGGTMWILTTCPFNSDHGQRGEVAVFQWPDGKLGFKCHHASCNKSWRDFREHFEPGYREKSARDADTIAKSSDGAIRPLGAYHDNDAGNAELFVDRFNDSIRYIHALKRWFAWDANRWRPDGDEIINQLAITLSKELIAPVLASPGKVDEDELRRPLSIGRQRSITPMLWLARSDPRIVI